MNWRCSENRADTWVEIGDLVGFAGLQIERVQLSMRDGDINTPIEAVDHGFESIDFSICLDDCAELPVCVCENCRGPGEGVDFVYSRGNILMDYGRRSLSWINRVGVECCIQLSGNSVETLVAEVERTIIVKGERNVWIGRH